MNKPISSNYAAPDAMLRQLASALKDKGQIRSERSAWLVGSMKVVFASTGKLDKLMSRLRPGHLKAQREAAFNEIHKLITTSKVKNGEQLLANIRTVMDQKGRLKGKDVAEQIDHFLSQDPDKIVRGGLVVPTAKSPISLMQVSPLRVVADYKIVRSTTLAMALAGKSEHREVAENVHHEMDDILKKRSGAQDPRGAGEYFTVKDPFSTAGKICVMADIGLQGDKYQSQFITDDDLKNMYRQMFSGLSGTVVVEPFADEATRKNATAATSYRHGKKHLRVLPEAMKEAVEAAKAQGRVLHFVIATEDAHVYQSVKDAASLSDSAKKPGLFQT